MTAEDHHCQSKMYSLLNPPPVQVKEQMRDIVMLLSTTDKVCCCVENGLELVQLVTRNTRQGRAAVIKLSHYQ